MSDGMKRRSVVALDRALARLESGQRQSYGGVMHAWSRRLAAAAAASLIAFVLPGCAPTLQELSAGRVGCSPAEISVSGTERSWVATCNGVEYQCQRNALPTCGMVFTGQGVGSMVGSTTDIACAPRRQGGPAAANAAPVQLVRGPTPADQAAAASHIERVHDHDHELVRAELAEAPFDMVLEGQPNRDGTLEWAWELPANAQATHDACEPLLLVDGVRKRLGVRSHGVSNGREVFRLIVSVSLLGELSGSKRAAGRLCDDEWHLTDPSRWVLAEYVARYREDASWGGQEHWSPPPCCAAHSMPCVCNPP
jgi:hypothetical protein